MAEDYVQWEYKVASVGSFFGTKDEQIESLLNAMGEEGWEAVNVFCQTNNSKVTIVAKRPLARSIRRWRSMPVAEEQ